MVAPVRSPGRRRPRVGGLLDALGKRSVGELAAIWVTMVIGFGMLYWLAGIWQGHGLARNGVPIHFNREGLLTALYFSAVTATSVGYGDVTPLGSVRLLAVFEAVAELLIFGGLVSKFVSRRQEELIEEIHHTSFEDRLGRVRTNLHLILAELQKMADLCAGQAETPPRILARIESAATVFGGEMQAIHDLLYRPHQNPGEQVLATILVSLAGGMLELSNLLQCLPPADRETPELKAALQLISGLAMEICGECVPRAYAAALKEQMNRIQELGRRIAPQ